MFVELCFLILPRSKLGIRTEPPWVAETTPNNIFQLSIIGLRRRYHIASLRKQVFSESTDIEILSEIEFLV